MNIAPEHRRLEFSAETRYRGQVWQLTLPLESGCIADAEALGGIVEDFHALHEHHYFVRDPHQAVEIVSLNCLAIGRLPQLQMAKDKIARSGKLTPKGTRQAYFAGDGSWTDVPVFAEEGLMAGDRIDGPAIIEAPITTIVVFPRSTAAVSVFGSLIVDIV